NGYSLKDKNKAKTEHENGKSVKKSKSTIQSQQVKDKAENEEILNGTIRTHLMEAAKEGMPPWKSSTFSLVEDTKIKSRAVMHCFEPKMEWKAGMKTSFPLTQQTQKAHLCASSSI
ncbi:hypothetical protein Tco_1572466, partial [Tanacetum coccineum]